MNTRETLGKHDGKSSGGGEEVWSTEYPLKNRSGLAISPNTTQYDKKLKDLLPW